jgi:hypothetical protein
MAFELSVLDTFYRKATAWIYTKELMK